MTVSSRALVEVVLLGPTNDRRQLQDSPILGDVWIAYAASPGAPMDLLITPHREQAAGPVASLIAKRIARLGLHRAEGEESHVAYLQGLVAARLFFPEVLRVIAPLTQWWKDRKVQDELQASAPERLSQGIRAIIRWARADDEDSRARRAEAFAHLSALERYVALTGVILWAGSPDKGTAVATGITDLLRKDKRPDDEIVTSIVAGLKEIFAGILADSFPAEAQIWQVSLNRKVMPALVKSVPAVKGDAARTLFKVKCDAVRWAILDSGIDGRHAAFNDDNGQSRIVGAFDFSNIRKIVSLDNLDTKSAGFRKRLAELLEGRDLGEPDPAKRHAKGAAILKDLAEDADNDRPIHWDMVEELIRIDPKTPPCSGHGTHVAGILGANGEAVKRSTAGASAVDGMCPDIKLYDFRVLAKTLEDTEFAIIAALQYIRYLNERRSFISVHGANLSLSIPHDVRNFACGRTPVCTECERLVESGVVVVAAAGNLGYQSFETKDGRYEGYTAFSITDPGNADGVITVGSTHRSWPHTYGVSFFSSRGPTGDGRLKPDLVAPGERIQSCLPDQGWGELDGTSMAAPHVSGAAAMLIARYSEMIGRPRHVKRVLCESATDLSRERTFQGHGMLDVLRAFQKI